jgi:non-canonical purine NTP pyrophosphatase (RdgB/HAM1 family)
VLPASVAFVTSNPGKAREAAAFLGRPVTARALDLPEIQSLDFVEVVRAKALEAARRLGEEALVEDSGLAVVAWEGFPGPLTRWITAEALGPAGLARMLQPFEDRRADAVSALGLALPGGGPPDVLVAVGRVAGSIAPAPRGANGFGWDTIFVPDGESRTWAEMGDGEKNRDSHRARSFREMARLLSRT